MWPICLGFLGIEELFLLETTDSAFSDFSGDTTDLSLTSNHRFRWYSGRYLYSRQSYYSTTPLRLPLPLLSPSPSTLASGCGVMELRAGLRMMPAMSSLASLSWGSLGRSESVKEEVKTEVMFFAQSLRSRFRNKRMRQSPMSPSIFKVLPLQHPLSSSSRVRSIQECCVGNGGRDCPFLGLTDINFIYYT